MKTLLCVGLLGLASIGCTKKIDTFNHTQPKSNLPEINVNVDIKIPDFDLDQDWQYDLAEKYGAVAFKAIYLCGKKYDYMLDNIDLSSDYGSAVLNDYQIKIEKCSSSSLDGQEVIPENRRHRIPRLGESAPLREPTDAQLKEIQNSNDFSNSLPVAEYNKSDPRYNEVKKMCEENNSYYKSGTDEFNSAVEFCVRKSM